MVPFTNPHLFTPETAGTSHYWFAMCLRKDSAGPHGQHVADEIAKVFGDTFDKEDTPMLELQQSSIGDDDFWGLKPVLLVGDAAGVRVRRQLDQLIAAEQAPRETAPA